MQLSKDGVPQRRFNKDGNIGVCQFFAPFIQALVFAIQEDEGAEAI